MLKTVRCVNVYDCSIALRTLCLTCCVDVVDSKHKNALESDKREINDTHIGLPAMPFVSADYCCAPQETHIAFVTALRVLNIIKTYVRARDKSKTILAYYYPER